MATAIVIIHGLVARPVIAVYTAVVYWLFHGKLRKGYD